MKIKFKKRVKVNLGGIFNLKTQNIPQVEKKEETTKQDSTTVTTTISKNKDKGITIKDAENAKEDKAIPKGTVIPTLQIPRLESKKVTIMLLENTPFMKQLKIERIATNISSDPDQLVTIVRYGENIETTTYNEKDNIIFDDKEPEKILFYDSLVEVSELVKRLYTEQKMFRIISVELICIGNCEDKESKKSKETAIKELNEIIQKYDIKNKYYCLSENEYLEAAEIGFHLIGSITTPY
ncbi:MAG: hypothetical protein BHW01_05815 [Clostridium sp. 27_14]|nr:MAG: hypothetical protein BHW01_05815 [Clostridium sp. 27_14]